MNIRQAIALLGFALVQGCSDGGDAAPLFTGPDGGFVCADDPRCAEGPPGADAGVETGYAEPELGTTRQAVTLLNIDTDYGACNGPYVTQYNLPKSPVTCYLPDALPIILKVVDYGSGPGDFQAQTAIGNAINAIFIQSGNALPFVWEGTSGAGGNLADIQFDLDVALSGTDLGRTTPRGAFSSHTPAQFGPRGSSNTTISIDRADVWAFYASFGLSGFTPTFTAQDVFNYVVFHELLHTLGLSHSGYGATGVNALQDLSVTYSGSQVSMYPQQKNMVTPTHAMAIMKRYLLNNANLPE